MGARRYRFGGFEFDADTGELTCGSDVRRLPPQPARVLALLVDKRGELLGREEIRRHVWPDVEVEFETSLHFCIRQIRAALGDSAASPRYVETLPRRGYRLVPVVERLDETVATSTTPARRGIVERVLALAGASVLAVALVGLVRSAAVETPPRIAIMPLTPPGAARDAPTPIADRILEELATRAGRRARIVGPTATRTYDRSDLSLRELAADYELDYIVNGRFLEDERGPRMLAELIRTSDGAHVWVKAYRELADDRGIGREIADAVLDGLDLDD